METCLNGLAKKEKNFEKAWIKLKPSIKRYASPLAKISPVEYKSLTLNTASRKLAILFRTRTYSICADTINKSYINVRPTLGTYCSQILVSAAATYSIILYRIIQKCHLTD